MSKKSLRKDMMAVLSSLDEQYKASCEEQLKSKFVEYIRQNDVNSIGIVLSMPHEMNTDDIILWMKAQGIAVYTPVCDYSSKEMNFIKFVSFDDVLSDEKNLRIPSDTSVMNNQPDLIAVPGLIFSREGYRIGYGGGFYDRFLKNYNGLKLSLLFDEQLGDVVKETHDVPVDILITPTETVDSRARRQINEE
ncbi:5-formyltetrahydrofolate cyclo-ligase [Salinicoccus albus]|uniref:5-formyltetrahydrofolate cyclo-ligase n=1 Tax=Salinicoccus albus TaxID=418756 RepID=UPI00037D5DFF|nr:5-formyltetrahydrofolate cyclo-ligase [Salinicoccus albus]